MQQLTNIIPLTTLSWKLAEGLKPTASYDDTARILQTTLLRCTIASFNISVLAIIALYGEREMKNFDQKVMTRVDKTPKTKVQDMVRNAWNGNIGQSGFEI